MDREPTFDVVDTPPPNKRGWPLIQEFEEVEKIINWQDLPRGMFRILEKNVQGRNRCGKSVVLKLEPKKGPILLTWAPSSLVYAIEKRKSTNFVLNHGTEICGKTGCKIYNFGVC